MPEKRDVTALTFTTRLVRTRRTIHKPTCANLARAKWAVPWDWAERHEDSEWVRLGWLVPCHRCLWDLANEQERLRASGDLITDADAYMIGELS